MPKLGTRKLYKMIKEDLISEQIKLGRDGLFEILREAGLLIRKRKNYCRTTNSNHWMTKYRNLIKDMEIIRPEQVLVSDITYIRTDKGFNYLSLVTDAYSRKIVGYKLSENLQCQGSIEALKMAIRTIRNTNKIIHHSDRGIQYCSKEYVSVLTRHGMEISMTDDGNVYENAIAERINGILKEEFGIGEGLKSYEQASRYIKQSIEIYNTQRPHMSCGLLTPAQAHDSITEVKKMWKSYPYKKSIKINEVNSLLTY
jgi:transposase InsO family protein